VTLNLGRQGGGVTAAKYWVAGARPRTLPAAVVPVAVGSGVAAQYHAFVAWRAGLALIVALALQIGVNYANDYSDGIKGTDEQRVGPIRLVGSGLAAPRKVLLAAWLSFFIAGVAGLVLAIVVSWWLLALGAAAIAAAWFYTGGSRPYGYHGLGEVSVFVFFGLGAVLGTAYVQMERLPWLALGAAVPVGLIACALLVINNLRDIPTDEESGKRTLAVVLGDRGTRALYAGCMTFPYTAAIVVSIWAPVVGVTILAVPLAVLPIRRVMAGVTGRDLIAVLGQTGRFQLGFGLLLTVGLAIRV
jgi:1,4-dihydroxy-2-naphthoate octaprenyltransferase